MVFSIMQDSPLTDQFWGKLRRENPGDRTSRVVAWHPLVDHCADVAACLVVLLGWRADGSFSPTLFNRRLARLGGLDQLDVVQVARLGTLAALHDVGKFNHGFQAKQEPGGGFAGHVSEALTLLDDGPGNARWSQCFADAIKRQSLEEWGDHSSAVLLLVAAISHHGRPAEVKSEHSATLVRCWQPNARDPFRGLADLRDATARWFPQAWSSGTTLPSAPPFQHGFCGLVQFADWLGSDTDFFPYSEANEGDHWPLALQRAVAAIAAIGCDATAARLALPSAMGFGCISHHPPRPMQGAIGELPLPTGPSLTLIEEETGGGKTEAALWHFLRLFSAGAVDGMYFALPTRTAATQLYQRVLVARDRCFPDPATRPPVIQAVPGYLGAEGAEGRPLPQFEVLWNDDPTKAERHLRWAAESPKRYLAGTIVVGTIDQVLLAALMVDHAHLRSACLMRHLLVIDEVHASDAYMTRILADLLIHTKAFGGHALLMSATLGASARDHLLKAWGAGTTTTWSQAVAMPYPTLLAAGSAPQVVAGTGRERQVTLTTASADDHASVAQSAIAAARAGARVLIIRNTVRDCLATQEALERSAPPELLWRVVSPSGLVPAPHHARFTRADRTHLDLALERSFGKDAPRDGGLIACATQTVQQALDLDADWMVTDLAPVDVLLQRLGRLHRHLRERPSGFGSPAVCVLMPQESLARWLDSPSYGPHGWGRIYEDLRVLEATRRLVLEGVWNIPQDNRRLVEGATHPEALALLDPTEPRWVKHGNGIIGKTLAQRDRARLGLLPWTTSFDDPRVCFPAGDLAPDIRTRLGDNDRRLLLPEAQVSPFGHRITELTLPGWLARGIGAEPMVTVTRSADNLALLVDGKGFRYDRLGLRTEDRNATVS